MWVKLKTLMAGPEGVRQPGAVVEIPDEQAQQLIDSHQAEKVAAPAPTPNPSPKGRGEKDKEKATSKQAQERETRGAKANG